MAASGTAPTSGTAPGTAPAAVLAAVAASRPDDGWVVTRALLMLHPTAPPWRAALPQIERLLAGRPGETLLSAFAEVPAKAVRMLVKRRAREVGVAATGQARVPWLDLLDASEAQASQFAGVIAGTLRLGNDVDVIEALLAQIAAASTGRRRALLDTLAETMAAGLGTAAGDPAVVSVSESVDIDDPSIRDLMDQIDVYLPPAADREGEAPFALPVEDVFTINGRGTVFDPDRFPRHYRPKNGWAMALPPEDAPATVGDDPPPAEDAPTADAPPTEQRRLQVQITDVAASKVRARAFRPGAQHKVAVVLTPEALAGHLVGPAINEAGIAFAAPEDGGPEVAALTVQFVSDAFGQTTSVSQPLLLPRTGASTTATFNLIVDAGAAQVTCSVLLFQGAALLQSALITGPVSARDRAAGGAALRIVTDGEFVSVVGPPPAAQAHPVQSSVSTHIGHPGEALVVGDEGRAASVVSLPGAAVLRAQITQALRMALDADSLSSTAAGRKRAAAAQVRLLRTLAKLGNLLYQDLPTGIQALGEQDAIQLICGSDDIVPFEIVYDYGFPTTTARLCGQWKQALSTGACTCVRVDGAVATICPLGFWGLRLVIERQVADSSATGSTVPMGAPSPGRNTLLPMTRVLFAASQKVDAAPDAGGDPKASAIADTVAVLTQRLGRANVTHVKTWTTWRSTVERKRPGLILSLPHNDRDDDDLPRLEIGRGKLLSVGALDRSYVLGAAPTADQVGPVVFLLGCNTANEALPWYTAAAAFRRRGASVVVGTLCEALGRQTAPMTRMLADLLWGAPGTDPIRAETLGDIMLLLRRRLVAEGMTLGMSLVAFGHAGWMLSAAPADPPEG